MDVGRLPITTSSSSSLDVASRKASMCDHRFLVNSNLLLGPRSIARRSSTESAPLYFRGKFVYMA